MNRAEQRSRVRREAFAELRKRFRTNVEMADALGEGFSPSFISQLLSGHRSIGDELATKIEHRLSLESGWLDGDNGSAAGNGSKDGPPEKGNVSKDYMRGVTTFEESDPLQDDEVVIPCLSLKLSAGTGRLEWEVDPNGKPNRYRKEWVQRRNLSANQLVTLHVAGDSMSPGLPDGCLVTIDKSATHIRNGKRHAIDYMGEFFIKRLFRQPDGSLTIRSDNPDKNRHPDWIVPYDRLDALRILGSIVHVQLDTDD